MELISVLTLEVNIAEMSRYYLQFWAYQKQSFVYFLQQWENADK